MQRTCISRGCPEDFTLVNAAGLAQSKATRPDSHYQTFTSFLPVSPFHRPSRSKVFLEGDANHTIANSLLALTSPSFPGLLLSRSFLAALGLLRRLCVREDLIFAFALLRFCFIVTTHLVVESRFSWALLSWGYSGSNGCALWLNLSGDNWPPPTIQVFPPPQRSSQH